MFRVPCLQFCKELLSLLSTRPIVRVLAAWLAPSLSVTVVPVNAPSFRLPMVTLSFAWGAPRTVVRLSYPYQPGSAVQLTVVLVA